MTACIQIRLTGGNLSKVSLFNCAMINKLALAGLMWKEAESKVRIRKGAEEDQGSQVVKRIYFSFLLWKVYALCHDLYVCISAEKGPLYYPCCNFSKALQMLCYRVTVGTFVQHTLSKGLLWQHILLAFRQNSVSANMKKY